ncbi:MAG TPA: hypothetical protein VEK75_10130 [Xanthobacteraceae bacterium]|nr:hypothetical protein [Xanthobacteraceae bacterium]
MRIALRLCRLLCSVVTCLVLERAALHAQSGQQVAPDLAAAMAQYRRALDAYNTAHDAYAAAAGAYWNAVAQKRQLRNAKRAQGEPLTIEDYVLTQPPVYTGPPKPRNPIKPEVPPRPVYVPVVADFLAAAQTEFRFTPHLPQSEDEFKRAYAKVALAAGLTRDQIVRIYGFEATGNGSYDVEAGLEFNKHARAITTALGYNQLLATNSVEILAEDGNRFVAQLHERAAQLPNDRKRALDNKIDVLRRMIAFARSVPDSWGQHEMLANTAKGLGVHALNLDVDLGPLLQTQKLLDSVIFARRKGLAGSLSAAELEMMNLTGDGNGFDMVTMPMQWRDKVPTANFFQPSGYADNPVAQRNNVVAKLIAATDGQMDQEIKKPGAQELAALLH